MNLPEILRVQESDRTTLTIILAPLAIFFLAVGVIRGVDLLHNLHYRGPIWPFLVAIIAAVHLTASGLAYLALWHRCHSHVSVQCLAIAATLVLLTIAGAAFLIIFQFH